MSVTYGVALARLQMLFPELPSAKVEYMLVRGLEEAEVDRFREDVEADLAQLPVLGGTGSCCGDPGDCQECSDV